MKMAIKITARSWLAEQVGWVMTNVDKGIAFWKVKPGQNLQWMVDCVLHDSGKEIASKFPSWCLQTM